MFTISHAAYLIYSQVSVYIWVHWSRALHSHTYFTGHSGTFLLFPLITLLLLQTFQKMATSAYLSGWIIIIHKFFFCCLDFSLQTPRAVRLQSETDHHSEGFIPHRASLHSAFKLHAEDTTWAGCRSGALRVVAVSHVFVEEECVLTISFIGSSAESSAWGIKWNQ